MYIYIFMYVYMYAYLHMYVLIGMFTYIYIHSHTHILFFWYVFFFSFSPPPPPQFKVIFFLFLIRPHISNRLFFENFWQHYLFKVKENKYKKYCIGLFLWEVIQKNHLMIDYRLFLLYDIEPVYSPPKKSLVTWLLYHKLFTKWVSPVKMVIKVFKSQKKIGSIIVLFFFLIYLLYFHSVAIFFFLLLITFLASIILCIVFWYVNIFHLTPNINCYHIFSLGIFSNIFILRFWLR